MAETVHDWCEEVRGKVRECSHTILCCWSDWEESSSEDEARAQSAEPYFDAMYSQLDTVILGVLDGCVSKLLAACDEFRDSVLHGRGPLESPCLDNDQTNAVLAIFDDTIGVAMKLTE